jgi:hypothetical protein
MIGRVTINAAPTDRIVRCGLKVIATALQADPRSDPMPLTRSFPLQFAYPTLSNKALLRENTFRSAQTLSP